MNAVSLRDQILGHLATNASGWPSVLGKMQVYKLERPRYDSLWSRGFVDPGGFLVRYNQLPAASRAFDLLVQDPVGDLYWRSEYERDGRPVPFRCGFILHFSEEGNRARIEILELVPAVWVGERWAFSRHGVGFSRVHDIRFVEPTVRDRTAVLDAIGSLVDSITSPTKEKRPALK